MYVGYSLSSTYQGRDDENSPKKSSYIRKLIEALVGKVDKMGDNLIAKIEEDQRKESALNVFTANLET